MSGNAAKAASKKTPPPFSLRLSAEERAYLEQQAGDQPLGAYIRERLLGDQATKRRRVRKPAANDKHIAAALSALGHSNLPSNLNQLAKHANQGTLDLSRDIEQELHEAHEAIIAMRDALFMALGHKLRGNL